MSDDLRGLYSAERQVHLILGGPPCKGFSRIGRAVIRNLRAQGVHAWTSKEYGDERNALVHKYVLFLEALRPHVFLFENVAHFQSTLKTPDGQLDAPSLLSQAIRDLSRSELDYDVSSDIVVASRFAVPQNRQRFIMVGIDSDVDGHSPAEAFFNLRAFSEDVPLSMALQGLGPPGEFNQSDSTSPRPSHQSPAYTLVDPNMPEPFVRYVEWIRQPLPSESSPPSHTDAHIVRSPRPDDLALIRKFAPGQRWMDYKLKNSPTYLELRATLDTIARYLKDNDTDNLPPLKDVSSLLDRVDAGLLLRLIIEEGQLPLEFEGDSHLLKSVYLSRGTDSHGDWFERLKAYRPSKTIVAHIGKDTYGYIHPFEDRAISMREAARIQSFPDFFRFGSAGIVEGYIMIGNAVPPLLAHAFAEQLAIINETLGVFSSRGSKRAQRTSRRTKSQLKLELGGD